MGLRGPTKEFNREVRADLTNAQHLHLRMRALAANQSVAAVLRHLISKDMEATKEEAVAAH
jgi:hypothetical protein